MKSFKTIVYLFSLSILITSFYTCSSSKNNQSKNYNFETIKGIENAYYTSWSAGVKGGGSGVNLFITVNSEFSKDVILDSVYFRGKVSKLETKPNEDLLYIGYFKTDFNTEDNSVLLNSELKTEKKQPSKIPFQLKNNECVVSYKHLGERMYYKITDIAERETTHYPSAPRQNN